MSLSNVFIYFTFQTIALHSEMMKKCRIDCWDVNRVLMLSDTSPVVGTSSSHYAAFGDDKMCCQVVREFLRVRAVPCPCFEEICDCFSCIMYTYYLLANQEYPLHDF